MGVPRRRRAPVPAAPAARRTSASTKRGSDGRVCVMPVRTQDDLGAVVLLVLEHLVSLGGIVQWQPVADHEARADLTSFDPLEQWAHVSMDMTLAALHRESPVHERTHGEL